MPPKLKISITSSDTSTGILELNGNPHPHHLVKPGTIISWEIDNNAVDSIAFITQKGYSDNIWTTLPSPLNRQKKVWTGEISNTAQGYDVYVYSITWYKNGNPHVFDPIISIKPDSTQSALYLVIPIILGILFIVQTIRLRIFRQQGTGK